MDYIKCKSVRKNKPSKPFVCLPQSYEIQQIKLIIIHHLELIPSIKRHNHHLFIYLVFIHL